MGRLRLRLAAARRRSLGRRQVEPGQPVARVGNVLHDGVQADPVGQLAGFQQREQLLGTDDRQLVALARRDVGASLERAVILSEDGDDQLLADRELEVLQFFEIERLLPECG